ncbi:FHA domain-containing protein, partial [Arsukibacterium sp.]|uniref:FHA domain-containing protein n=1 Tax=Arsukibacterium sp. TaxID=1977258 RepID=UPI002FD8D85F
VISALYLPQARADYVYPLQIERANNRSVSALVTKINEHQFITDAELVKSANSLFIIDNSVTPAAKIVATVVFADNARRIAVLSASNVSGKAVTLAAQDQTVGGQLLLLTDAASLPTLVQRFEPVKDLAPGNIYVHTALYNNQQWAAPLLNNCQQLLGLSVFESSLFNRMQLPEVIAYGTSSAALKAVLTEQKINFTLAPERCLSDVEQATANAEKAAQDAATAKAAQEAADAAAQNTLAEAQKQADIARAAADKLLQEAKDNADKIAQEHAEKLKQIEEAIEKAELERAEAETLRQQAEQKADEVAEKNKAAEQQKHYLLLGGAAVIVLLLLVFMLVMRKRKQAIQAKEAELQQQKQHASGLAKDNEQLVGKVAQMQLSFNDVLLDGTTHDGRKIRIKINGKALAQSTEQIIGRETSQVDYPIAESEISRRHLRLLLRNGTLLVEDLQSQNGSWLNHSPLLAGEPVELVSGSVLRLSTIVFQVSYL